MPRNFGNAAGIPEEAGVPEGGPRGQPDAVGPTQDVTHGRKKQQQKNTRNTKKHTRKKNGGKHNTRTLTPPGGPHTELQGGKEGASELRLMYRT